MEYIGSQHYTQTIYEYVFLWTQNAINKYIDVWTEWIGWRCEAMDGRNGLNGLLLILEVNTMAHVQYKFVSIVTQRVGSLLRSLSRSLSLFRRVINIADYRRHESVYSAEWVRDTFIRFDWWRGFGALVAEHATVCSMLHIEHSSRVFALYPTNRYECMCRVRT